MKKGIIFDMDGTLWDSAKEVADSWSIITKKRFGEDKVITEEKIRSVMGLTMDVLATKVFDFLDDIDVIMDTLDECGKFENDYLRENGAYVYPGVEETFSRLKDMGYNLYIVSNCQSGYIEAFLDYYGYGKYIDDIECYGNNNLKKGDNIKLVVERNKLDKAVYVGDIQGDYDSSVEAGIKFIHAAYGFGTINAPVPKIEAFSELPQIISQVI